MFGWFKPKKKEFAFTAWVRAKGGRKVKIGVPVGMTVGELEDILHERYWSPPSFPSEAARKQLEGKS